MSDNKAKVAVKTIKQVGNSLILQIADMFVLFRKDQDSVWSPICGSKHLEAIEAKV